MMENEQKPRFHEKVAKLCILIGDLQRRKHHPDTWSGILIFGGISHLLATQTTK